MIIVIGHKSVPFLFFGRELIKIKRRKNLKIAVDRLQQNFNFEQHIFISHYYEPERTTNPDGVSL